MRSNQKFIGLMFVAVLAAVAVASSSNAQESIKLPVPQTSGGMPLMEALAKRQSIRSYSGQALSQQLLSDLLWAAFGINRPESGDHTAPSWRGSKEIDIYVATAEGVWLYNPKANDLRRHMAEDIRGKTSSMVFAGSAPVVLIYVADLTRMAKAPREEQMLNAHVDAAMVGQNVYLFSASAGLGTVIMGSVDREGLPKRLGLRNDQIVTFAQTVGFPK